MDKINLLEVEIYFTKKKFRVIKIEQIWRHVTGILRQNSVDYFLKLATTKEIAQGTKNEFAWNNLINSLPKNQQLPVFVPQNQSSGEYKDLFWYLSSYAGDSLLLKPDQNDQVGDLENKLPIIAETALKIIKIKSDSNLPLDKIVSKKEMKEMFLKKLEYWATETSRDVTDLIEFIKKRLSYLQIAPSHGDFVPWHFVKSNKTKLFLVDGEHAHILGLKFYDVAYFYHRVYTKLKRHDIADKFLKEFDILFKFSDEEKELFKLVLAQRLIGGYFDAGRDNITSVNMQDELETKLFQDKLFTIK